MVTYCFIFVHVNVYVMKYLVRLTSLRTRSLECWALFTTPFSLTAFQAPFRRITWENCWPQWETGLQMRKWTSCTEKHLLTKRGISITSSSLESLSMEQKTNMTERTWAKTFQLLCLTLYCFLDISPCPP